MTCHTLCPQTSQLLERQTELPLPWAPVCDVIVQLEISGKWPEEPEAIRRVRAALHLQVTRFEEVFGNLRDLVVFTVILRVSILFLPAFMIT